MKFIRLAFVDLYGTLKNMAITPSELPRAFAGGFSFDPSAVKGFCDVAEGELFLQPDPSTLCVLPWASADRTGGAHALRLLYPGWGALCGV